MSKVIGGEKATMRVKSVPTGGRRIYGASRSTSVKSSMYLAK